MSTEAGMHKDSMSPPELGRLANKVSVITGSAQGIGQGIASVMANHGAHVVLWDVAEHVYITADVLKKKGLKALSQRVDVTNASAVKEAVQKIRELFLPHEFR